jgi:hypothetical protein
MRISRRSLLLGAGGAVVASAGLVSLPGGGPRTYWGGIPPAYDFGAFGAAYAPQELRAELSWLVDTMREVGAKPFAFSDELAFDAAYRERLARFDRPATACEFYLAAAGLFAGLNDGHVSIGLGRTYDVWRDERGGRAFPVLANLSEHGLFVDVETDPSMPRGSKIESVDGTPASVLIDRLVALQGAQTPAIRRSLVGSDAAYALRQLLYALYGERPSFHVVALRPDGTIARKELVATTAQRMREQLARASRVGDPNYVFSRIGGGRVGYIDYRHCTDAGAFEAFLRNAFAGVKAAPVDGIVIDIRTNGGGDSDVNDVLWPFVSAKPFSPGGRFLQKVSARLKREYGFWSYNVRYLPPAWFARDGALIQMDFTRFTTVHPGPNPLRFDGPVYLLIGRGTFSSAIGCASEAKTYGLATVVGEATAPVNATGEVYQGLSPRIGVRFQFTTKYFNDYGFHALEGVEPDVTVVPTEADLRAGRDVVLGYAVDAILRRRS